MPHQRRRGRSPAEPRLPPKACRGHQELIRLWAGGMQRVAFRQAASWQDQNQIDNMSDGPLLGVVFDVDFARQYSDQYEYD